MKSKKKKKKIEFIKIFRYNKTCKIPILLNPINIEFFENEIIKIFQCYSWKQARHVLSRIKKGKRPC